MIDLREFFFAELEELSPYKKYKDIIEEGVEDGILGNYLPDVKVALTTSLEEDMIRDFKQQVQPSNVYSQEENYKFILVNFYLYKKGYYIEQFPNQLSNPDPLSVFAGDRIRQYCFSRDLNDGGTIRWDTRREVIRCMSFQKRENIDTHFDEDIEESFKRISTRNSSFSEMTNAEKIKEISNLIENKLKVNGKFIELKSGNTLGLLTNADLMKYRRLTQCYRHSTDEALIEREKYKKNELFLIHYGISYLHAIFETD